MVDADKWVELANALAEMARDFSAQDSARATLDRVVAHAVALVDGCDAAGVMVLRRGEVVTLAASDNMVVASDRLQGECGEGPCFDAARNKHEAYRITDLSTRSEQWPNYAPKARKLGIGSMMGFLLYTRDKDLGALDLYSSRPGAFEQQEEHVGWLLASHAAVAMAGAEHIENLETALETRKVIGEAVGILMARYKLAENDAFGRIVKASQDSNVKVRDLAVTITMTGEIPERS
ncbi:MAG TPA: GAF and ANTAR domain-containing protein [Pseudonocardia sp.]|uniref:GAF and ANTAR domain-containing protein n=1 Tax=Pseudonocardia sp. TaxID=60912 RepID=UPI002B932685|nr:GAF and ANTAR domain-containing protein [Pseudonocardia sp.]HTF55406.1 GAF and ANTAR domain-containing protein [Pseudonocardia sp.]